MLTIMCPNCRHQFPALECCESREEANRKEAIVEEEKKKSANTTAHPATCYVGGLLVPRGYTSGGSCFTNASSIIHRPAIFQSSVAQCGSTTGIASSESGYHIPSQFPNVLDTSPEESYLPAVALQTICPNRMRPPAVSMQNLNFGTASSERHVEDTYELTIAAPSIQSGGCLIQNTEAEILVQSPRIEVRPNLTGGGCVVQKKLSTENEQLTNSECTDDITLNDYIRPRLFTLSSLNSELSRSGDVLPLKITQKTTEITSTEAKQQKTPKAIKVNNCGCSDVIQNACQHHEQLSNEFLVDDRNDLPLQSVGTGNSLQIQVNATVQLPASLGQCTVNITATTSTSSNRISTVEPRSSRNNFNGGGILQPNELHYASRRNQLFNRDISNCIHNEQRNGTPTTPVSWLTPYPWSLDTSIFERDINRLREIKRMLQTCGWYHEGISWQQSEGLLKDAPVGRWLMRDSSDSRYTFAVSVQTARGPTSVRVHYFLEHFRLDAEPRLILAMPLFSCPIRLLEYYVEYSKKMSQHRREVWVDYSGELYSQIYLTQPLIKEVRSLSHLARLAVNKYKLFTEHLPLLIKNYLAEYPYTL